MRMACTRVEFPKQQIGYLILAKYIRACACVKAALPVLDGHESVCIWEVERVSERGVRGRGRSEDEERVWEGSKGGRRHSECK